MKVYLASNREQIALAKDYAAKLEALGHSITHKWWEDVERLGTADNQEADGEELFDCAVNDMVGVMSAEVFWLLAPKAGGTGCWVELGMAIMMRDLGDPDDMDDPDSDLNPDGRRIVVSGAHERTLFTILNEVNVCVDSHDEAFEYITKTIRTEDAA